MLVSYWLLNRVRGVQNLRRRAGAVLREGRVARYDSIAIGNDSHHPERFDKRRFRAVRNRCRMWRVRLGSMASNGCVTWMWAIQGSFAAADVSGNCKNGQSSPEQ